MNDQLSSLVLGIDTGGTFTDGVVIDTKTDEVLAKAKANTTREDLSIGIINCIEALNLPSLPHAVSLVCLSTTLATNSVVEGKVSRVGLITSNSDALREKFLVDEWYRVSGKVEISGEILEDIDAEEVDRALKAITDKIDSLVISGYAGIRNPAHELFIKKAAKKHLSVPIICAHELSMSLGFNERTATAVLNAHLLPVINNLIEKTKLALREQGIDAKIVMVKGDGSMMLESIALERPVETVLSGPAASVVGGASLTNVKDAFVVDLGGTTMDIACMRDGRVSIVDDGATINGWQTKIKAVDIHTFGLGGDSQLVVRKDDFSFGPRKAVPLCYACGEYPNLTKEIRAMAAEKTLLFPGFFAAEGFLLNSNYSGSHLTEFEKKLTGLLADGPHSAPYICKHCDRGERRLGIDSLLNKGILQVISLTPTDLLHITGDYVRWNKEASQLGLDILAQQLKLPAEQLLEQLIARFTDQLTFAMIKSAFAFENNYCSEVIDHSWFYDRFFAADSAIKLLCQIEQTIIALGAPANAWLTRLSETLHTEVVLPKHAEVANAIGAAKGTISETIETLIRYDLKAGVYRVHLPWEMADLPEYCEAREYAMEKIDRYIEEMTERLEIENYSKNVNEVKEYLSANEEDGTVFEARITVMVSARPSCIV